MIPHRPFKYHYEGSSILGPRIHRVWVALLKSSKELFEPRPCWECFLNIGLSYFWSIPRHFTKIELFERISFGGHCRNLASQFLKFLYSGREFCLSRVHHKSPTRLVSIGLIGQVQL